MYYNTTTCVKNNGLWRPVGVARKNDGLRCCNKLSENNLDFATGP